MNLNLSNINKKIIIFFASFGFILSFIAGLFSGSSFINLLLRSIVSGFIIGILIVIIYIIIMLYLPELLDDYDLEANNTDSEGHVDIVMPEEDYKVQANSEGYDSSDDGVYNDSSNSSDSSFKEVDLDNLKSLSASDILDSDTSNNSDLLGEDESLNGKSNISNSVIGNHSIEDMSNAVKTILKKD